MTGGPDARVMTSPEDVAREKRRWAETTLAEALARHAERRTSFETVSGRPVDTLATPADILDVDFEGDIGFPGDHPYTRGIQPTMYRGRLWTMRQYAGFGTADESNKRYKFLLDHGTTGLSVAFDLPTQIGYDSDDPMAEGEVGKVGVAIDSLADMERLFDGIPLDRVSTSMTINAPGAILLAMYIAVAEKQGVPATKISGTIQNDILKEYIARGTYIFPPEQSMRLVTDVFAYCTENVPRWNTISVSGYHIREAGSTAAQEIAFTLADGIAYVKAAVDAGLDVDDFAPQISFFFNSHLDFLEEVAKFRAARRLWARIMKDRFGAKNAKSMMLRFHTQTAGSSLTAQEPENNVVRTTLEALAAVLGGTQSLHTNSLDEALGLPTEKAARIALRTQQIIAHESGAANTLDPLAGSYFVEAQTSGLEAEAEAYLEKIEAAGGMLRAIETGYVQREIQEAAYKFQRAVETKKFIWIGVNEHRSDDIDVEVAKADPALEAQQVAALAKVRAERDATSVDAALARLREGARGRANMMPLILDAVKAYATVGEICGLLREEWGEYRPRDEF